MRKTIITMTFAGIAAFSASALNISLTPGEMQKHFADISNTSDEQLVLSGTADVRDLALLRQLSPSVKTVDMSQLDIAAYTYPEGNYMGLTSFAANELPAYVMAGSDITSVKLPVSCSVIGRSAFMGSQLQSIDIPASVTRIADYAFSNANSLKTASCSGDVAFGVGVFKDCVALTDVTVSPSIRDIPASMFDGCVLLACEIPESVTKIGDFAYRATALTEVNLSNVTEVGSYSFADMKKLQSIIINENRKLKMGAAAFFNSGELSEFPQFTTDLSNAAFAHSASNVKNLTVHSATIGVGAYANNAGLDTITLGPAVRSVGAHAFRNAGALTMVDACSLGTNIPEVDAESFSGLLNDEGRYGIKLNVEDGTQQQWEEHPVWGLFEVGHYKTGVEDVVADGVVISARRDGRDIIVTSTDNIDYIGVFSVNGTVLHEAVPSSMEYTVSDIDNSGVVVIKVISGGISKIVKLM